MKIAAIIQARTGSTRLPNKVFAEICGKPIIWHVVDRLKHSKIINEIIIATTTNKRDDVLENWAKQNKVKIFRGSEEDVLLRFYCVAKENNINIIVRITADDPFKDPEVIDMVISEMIVRGDDFTCNNNPPTFPEGLDTEVFKFEALERAQNESSDLFEREHVTQFFYRNPRIYKISNIPYPENISYLRWTIDEEKDLNMTRNIYNALYQPGKIFLMKDILEYLDRNPEVAKMNASINRSSMYNNIKGVIS